MKLEQINLKEIYKDILSKDVILKCYLQENFTEIARSKSPAIIIFPGGAYAYLSNREAEPVALSYFAKGYNVFILNYSIAPACFPVQLYESLAAIDYIRTNANKLNVVASKIAVVGFSAGGHCAGMAAVLSNETFVKEKFKNNVTPNVAILCYPVITAYKFNEPRSIQNISGGDETLKPILSLENRVTKDTPPCFLCHTSDDGCVDVRNSLLFATKLRENNINFELHIYPNGPHGISLANELVEPKGMPNFNYRAGEWFENSLKFLKENSFNFEK